MRSVYPIKVVVNSESEKFTLKFAREAATILENDDRVSCEINTNGLLLKGVWDLDIQHAIKNIKEKIEGSIVYTDYTIEYRKDGSILLEPVMIVEVTCPELYMGDVMGDMNRRRGIVENLIDSNKGKLIKAKIPLSELIGYYDYLNNLFPYEWVVNVEFFEYQQAPNPDGTDPNEPVSKALRA